MKSCIMQQPRPQGAEFVFVAPQDPKERVSHSLPAPPGPSDAGHGDADGWCAGCENACQGLLLREE